MLAQNSANAKFQLCLERYVALLRLKVEMSSNIKSFKYVMALLEKIFECLLENQSQFEYHLTAQ
jgi:hypothetical protein